jgi:hypothetical protein
MIRKLDDYWLIDTKFTYTANSWRFNRDIIATLLAKLTPYRWNLRISWKTKIRHIRGRSWVVEAEGSRTKHFSFDLSPIHRLFLAISRKIRFFHLHNSFVCFSCKGFVNATNIRKYSRMFIDGGANCQLILKARLARLSL